MIAPDTIQNILVSSHLLLAHNFLMLFFALIFLLSFLACYRNPNRSYLLLMTGALCFLFFLEYQKHIKIPLLEQTRNSLITARYSARIDILLRLLIVKGIPSLTFLAGKSMMLGAIYYSEWFRNYRKNLSNQLNFDN